MGNCLKRSSSDSNINENSLQINPKEKLLNKSAQESHLTTNESLKSDSKRPLMAPDLENPERVDSHEALKKAEKYENYETPAVQTEERGEKTKKSVQLHLKNEEVKPVVRQEIIEEVKREEVVPEKQAQPDLRPPSQPLEKDVLNEVPKNQNNQENLVNIAPLKPKTDHKIELPKEETKNESEFSFDQRKTISPAKSPKKQQTVEEEEFLFEEPQEQTQDQDNKKKEVQPINPKVQNEAKIIPNLRGPISLGRKNNSSDQGVPPTLAESIVQKLVIDHDVFLNDREVRIEIEEDTKKVDVKSFNSKDIISALEGHSERKPAVQEKSLAEKKNDEDQIPIDESKKERTLAFIATRRQESLLEEKKEEERRIKAIEEEKLAKQQLKEQPIEEILVKGSHVQEEEKVEEIPERHEEERPIVEELHVQAEIIKESEPIEEGKLLEEVNLPKGELTNQVPEEVPEKELELKEEPLVSIQNPAQEPQEEEKNPVAQEEPEKLVEEPEKIVDEPKSQNEVPQNEQKPIVQEEEKHPQSSELPEVLIPTSDLDLPKNEQNIKVEEEESEKVVVEELQSQNEQNPIVKEESEILLQTHDLPQNEQKIKVQEEESEKVVEELQPTQVLDQNPMAQEEPEKTEEKLAIEEKQEVVLKEEVKILNEETKEEVKEKIEEEKIEEKKIEEEKIEEEKIEEEKKSEGNERKEPIDLEAELESKIPEQIDSHLIEFRWAHPGENVFLAGEWNGWQQIPLEKHDENNFSVKLKLERGFYHYKFVVDGKWVCDENANQKEEGGNANNYIEIY